MPTHPTPMERALQSAGTNHLGMIERAMNGDNHTGFDDRTGVISHARRMQQRINELEQRLGVGPNESLKEN